MSSTQKFQTYISIIYKHSLDEYYSCEHNMHKNKENEIKKKKKHAIVGTRTQHVPYTYTNILL
jgi:hypothetical protein